MQVSGILENMGEDVKALINLRQLDHENKFQKLFDSVHSSISQAEEKIDRKIFEFEETKRLYEELQSVKKELDLILDCTPDQMAHIDLDYKVRWANKSLLKFHGLTAEQARRLKCHELIAGSSIPCEDCKMKMVIEKRDAIEFKLSAGGKKFWYKAVPAKNGVISGIVIVIREITNFENLKDFEEI